MTYPKIPIKNSTSNAVWSCPFFMDRFIKRKEQFEGPSAFVPLRSVERFLRDPSMLHDDTNGRPSSRPGGLKHVL